MSNLLTKYRFELSYPLERMVNESQKTAIESDLKFARRYLNLLVAKIEKEIEDKVKDAEAEIGYENPNWPFKQADLLGYRRAMRKVIDIIRPIEEHND